MAQPPPLDGFDKANLIGDIAVAKSEDVLSVRSFRGSRDAKEEHRLEEIEQFTVGSRRRMMKFIDDDEIEVPGLKCLPVALHSKCENGSKYGVRCHRLGVSIIQADRSLRHDLLKRPSGLMQDLFSVRHEEDARKMLGEKGGEIRLPEASCHDHHGFVVSL